MQAMMSSTYHLARQLCEYLLATLDVGPNRQRKTITLLYNVVCSICDRSYRLNGTEFEVALLVRSTLRWLMDETLAGRPLDYGTVVKLRELIVEYLGNECLTSEQIATAYDLVASLKHAPTLPVAEMMVSMPPRN